MAGKAKTSTRAAAKPAAKPAATKTAAKAQIADPGYELRQGEPGQSLDFTLANGDARSLIADARGVFTPQRLEDVAILDGFGLKAVKRTDSGAIRKLPAKPELATATVLNTGSVETAAELATAKAEDAQKATADADGPASSNESADAEKGAL